MNKTSALSLIASMFIAMPVAAVAEAEDVKLSEAAEMEKIAKMTANPLGAAWLMWTQDDYTQLSGDALDGDEYMNSVKFQPVMSFPMDMNGEDWNFIVRPVFQYQNFPVNENTGAFDGRTSGVGDTVLLTLMGPNKLDGTIWGVGISQIFPTAEEDVLGQDKWQAGPAFLYAHLAPDVGGWNYGALAQHWWSYAGEDDREDSSQTDIQYFFNYRLSATELVGMTPNIRIDWKQDSDNALTLPVGLGYSNIYKIGDLPIRVLVEGQYAVISPDNVGTDWNVRVIIAPVIANPFR